MPVHSWNGKVIAADTSRRRIASARAAERDRLAPLDGGQPLRTPATEKQIHTTTGVIHEMSAFAERKVVSTTKVQYVANIEVAIAVIGLYPGSGDIHGPITSNGRSIEQVSRVASAAGISIGGKEIQATRETLFEGGLKTIVMTVPIGGLIGDTTREVWEEDWGARPAGVSTWGKDLGDVICTFEYF